MQDRSPLRSSLADVNNSTSAPCFRAEIKSLCHRDSLEKRPFVHEDRRA